MFGVAITIFLCHALHFPEMIMLQNSTIESCNDSVEKKFFLQYRSIFWERSELPVLF